MTSSPRVFAQVRCTGLKAGNPKPVILKNGQPSIETVKHWWAVCDVCGEGMWIEGGRFEKERCESCGSKRCDARKPEKVCCDRCRHPVGVKCKMTPRCGGRHRKDEL